MLARVKGTILAALFAVLVVACGSSSGEFVGTLDPLTTCAANGSPCGGTGRNVDGGDARPDDDAHRSDE